MITDTEIRNKGFRVLIESLGEIEAERFISLVAFEKVGEELGVI